MIYISFDIGVKNLALCILEHSDDKLSIIDWRVISLADSKKEFKGMDLISDVVYAELDNIVGCLQGINVDFIDKVIIENQPSNLNGVMKIIQMLIYGYFSLLKHWDNKVGEVILINAVHKLQNHEFVPSSKMQATYTSKPDRREKYKLNKQDSIEICKHYIKDDNKLISIFQTHKKKDDLADTCIQTISYIRKNGSAISTVSLNEMNLLREKAL